MVYILRFYISNQKGITQATSSHLLHLGPWTPPRLLLLWMNCLPWDNPSICAFMPIVSLLTTSFWLFFPLSSSSQLLPFYRFVPINIKYIVISLHLYIKPLLAPTSLSRYHAISLLDFIARLLKVLVYNYCFNCPLSTLSWTFSNQVSTPTSPIDCLLFRLLDPSTVAYPDQLLCS